MGFCVPEDFGAPGSCGGCSSERDEFQGSRGLRVPSSHSEGRRSRVPVNETEKNKHYKPKIKKYPKIKIKAKK